MSDKHTSIRRYFRGIRSKQQSAKAGLILETSLFLPVLLLVIWFMLSAGLTVQHELAIRYALDQVSHEVSLLIPLAEYLHTELHDAETERLIEQIIPHEREELRLALTDLASSIFLQNFLQRRLDTWLDGYAQTFQVRIPPDERKLIIETWDTHAWAMRLNYHVSTPWTRTARQCSTMVPLWTRFGADAFNAQGDSTEHAEDSIWSADNFTRGRYFRKRYGANLPFNYPVISAYKDGTVTAVRSIDLTAPSYDETENVLRQVYFEIERLSAFSGSTMKTGIEPAIITEQLISKRNLLIVVPRNSTHDLADHNFSLLFGYAREKGIDLIFQRVGESKRYQQDIE